MAQWSTVADLGHRDFEAVEEGAGPHDSTGVELIRNTPPPRGIGPLYGPTGGLFLMSEVPFAEL